MFYDTNQITIHGGQITQNAQNTFVVQSGKGGLFGEPTELKYYN